jgi:hypothetical protein
MNRGWKIALWAWALIVLTATFFSVLGEFLNRASWAMFLLGALVLVPLYLLAAVRIGRIIYNHGRALLHEKPPGPGAAAPPPPQ